MSSSLPATFNPDWRVGLWAALPLGMAAAGLVGFYTRSEWGALVQLIALVRLLFVLPPLGMFAVVLAVRRMMPQFVAPMLALTTAGLTLWSAYEVARDLYSTAR